MDPDTCVYETGVDDTVSVFTSMDVGDDPSYEQAMRSNDTQPMPTDAAGQRLRLIASVPERLSLAFDDEEPCPNLFGGG